MIFTLLRSVNRIKRSKNQRNTNPCEHEKIHFNVHCTRNEKRQQCLLAVWFVRVLNGLYTCWFLSPLLNILHYMLLSTQSQLICSSHFCERWNFGISSTADFFSWIRDCSNFSVGRATYETNFQQSRNKTKIIQRISCECVFVSWNMCQRETIEKCIRPKMAHPKTYRQIPPVRQCNSMDCNTHTTTTPNMECNE